MLHVAIRVISWGNVLACPVVGFGCLQLQMGSVFVVTFSADWRGEMLDFCAGA